MNPFKITDKEEEIILCCPHVENFYDPQIFMLEEKENATTVLWLCGDCFNKIGVRWIREILTVRLKAA